MANISTHKQAFVLAFSLLISSIVLALAFGIFNILLKQIVLTSSARDSQIAFYAADAGAECALYWDTHNSRTVQPPFYDVDGNYRYSYRGMFVLPTSHPDIASIDESPYPNDDVAKDLNDSSTFLCGVSVNSGDIESDVSSNVAVTSFRVNLNSEGTLCALVTVEKGWPNLPDDPQFDTRIISSGYNDCSGNTTNLRRVERTIQVRY